MSQKWKLPRFLILVASALSLSTCLATAQTTIVIVVKSKDGHSVNATPMRRRAGGNWRRMPVKPIKAGYYEVTVDDCSDLEVEFTVQDKYGNYTRDLESVRNCTEPEIVFDDLTPVGFAALVPISAITDSGIWAIALASEKLGGATTTLAERFSTKFNSAITEAQYGRVAIAGAEIAKQLQDVGKSQEAEIFRLLSIDATARGAYAELGLNVDQVSTLTYDWERKRYYLTAPAKDVLKRYQREKLRIEEVDTAFGATGWATMRSLPGGRATMANEFTIPLERAEIFSADGFEGRFGPPS